MKKITKRLLQSGISFLGYGLYKKVSTDYIDTKLVSLKPQGQSKGNVLFGFIIEPFLIKPGELISNAHSHDWESYLMAQTFLDMGYSVDVISYRNITFKPHKDYDIFVAARTNFERVASLLNKDCIKIVHLDTSHWLFNNQATYTRLLDLLKRRGVALQSGRFIERNKAIEYADYGTVLGNNHTMNTYKYAKKELFPIPVSSPEVYPWSDKKDFEICKKKFLWFGSAGFVHKGLDLVLEAFADLPQCNLTVCGPIDTDEEFVQSYYKELYNTPNITTIGWVDISSEAFRIIAESCIALIYPSCAEGQNGGAITCMHAGMIPILSYQSGIDLHDFGITLHESSVDEIKQSVMKTTSLNNSELEKMAKKAWEYARKNHTRDQFVRVYQSVIENIIDR